MDSLADFYRDQSQHQSDIPTKALKVMSNILVDHHNQRRLEVLNPSQDDQLSIFCSEICRDYVKTLNFKRRVEPRKYLKIGKGLIVAEIEEEELQRRLFEKFSKYLEDIADLSQSQGEFETEANLLVRTLDHSLCFQSTQPVQLINPIEYLRLENPIQRKKWHEKISGFDRMVEVSNSIDFTKISSEMYGLAWKAIQNAEVIAYSLARDWDDYRLRIRRSLSRIDEEMK